MAKKTRKSKRVRRPVCAEETCGKKFAAARRTAKFCSVRCRVKFHREASQDEKEALEISKGKAAAL